MLVDVLPADVRDELLESALFGVEDEARHVATPHARETFYRLEGVRTVRLAFFPPRGAEER